MSDPRRALVVDIDALVETHFTGIPNVIAEVCARLLAEEDLDLLFLAHGRAIEHAALRRCLDARSGRELLSGSETAGEALARFGAEGRLATASALYTDHRPPWKLCGWEGKIVYDLSMVLAPECHPATSVALYTDDLPQQIACSDVFFAISAATAHDLETVFGVPEPRIRIATLGNNVDRFMSDRMRARIGGRAVEPFLLVLGSIEPRKNAALVLEWLSRHPAVLSEFRVVFAGRQAWGDSFVSSVAARSLEGEVARRRIVHLGFVDDAHRAMLLVGASALLYPSIFEGFGLPLLEAMAIGTPVLSSCSTSMPEVVGDCGYLFDPYDVASLHDAFERFRADRASGAIESVRERLRARAERFRYDDTYRVILEGLFPAAGDRGGPLVFEAGDA